MINNTGEEQQVLRLFDQLRERISIDFVALAFQNVKGTDITWRYAAGNSNDKYKRITVRYGKGVAGKVILTGRSILVEEFPHNISGTVLDYPIMLAEKLVSVYAVPLFPFNHPKGVLLIGRRNKAIFTKREQLDVQMFAEDLESIIMI
ncbi:GAF domain-containing protein [Pseudobacillus wudalianchiensis]|uniref:GAF domain-containing protein n=1 Tax=Pseudobacillus wudalianchiensis TaxID=1743143 RepID=A0A1B9AMP5_9BACI|nr:GAF domain-containing protein [Bacillus wudalianchiensis]OCA85130.1 hypothetical protein A8F95_10625 [Bacillus wudalianchiensis]